jgi:hypothetical protein
MTGAHPRQAVLERGHQPGLFDEFDNLGRQARRPGIAGLHAVERAVEVDDQARLIHLVVAQDSGNVAIGSVGELYQPVLDLDIIVGARQGRPAAASSARRQGSFNRPTSAFRSIVAIWRFPQSSPVAICGPPPSPFQWRG